MINFNTKRDIGIKITGFTSLPTCISIIRKYRDASMGEIKSEIETCDFVFTCDFVDTDGLIQLISCHDELCNAGSSITIQEQDRIITRDILQNLLQTHKEIHEETLIDINAEAIEDE